MILNVDEALAVTINLELVDFIYIADQSLI